MIIGPQSEHSSSRLKMYSASSTNGRHTLVITVEYADPREMGWDVTSLDETLKADRGRDAELKAAAKRPKSKPKQLALPSPTDFEGL